MRDTITVVQALGTTFDFSHIKCWVNYIGIPLLFGWLGYKIKDYLNKTEITRLQNSVEKSKEEVASLEKRLEQVKFEKARGDSDNITLEAEIQKFRAGVGKK